MIKKLFAVVFVASIVCFGVVAITTKGDSGTSNSSKQEAESNTQWVARCLKEMQTIKPGMTRGELLTVFMEEGGLSTVLEQTYVHKQCPLFKVDVQFKIVDRASRDRDGRVTVKSDNDVITKISKPYIAWGTID